METAFLIMLREGFEAALVVAIVLAYVRKIGRRELSRPVWQGVLIAATASVAIGVAIHMTVGELEGPPRQRAFAAVSLLALAVLTWMIFWMKRQSRHIKGDLEHRIDRAIQSDRVRRGIVAVALLAVLREGIEAALFLVAAATEEAGREVLIGGLAGLAIAAVAAYAVYFGGRKAPMRAFFRVTGVILILFAAGLLARSVGYVQNIGDVGSFNLNGVYDVRSIRWLSPADSEIGRFLAAMGGWDPRPSIEQVIAYLGYLIPVTWLFLRPPRPRPRPSVAPRPAATELTTAGVE